MKVTGAAAGAATGTAAGVAAGAAADSAPSVPASVATRAATSVWAAALAALMAMSAPAAIGAPPPNSADAPSAAATSPTATSPAAPYAAVTPDRPLVFPADFGSHPAFRTEWWYVTGWLTTRGGESLGFQITFFRTKPGLDDANPSAFAARQILIAHCAISDPKRGQLWQDQRIRRAGFGLSGADEGDTNVWIDKWTLRREAGVYDARIAAEDFSLELKLSESQPPLPNGASGFSRKGPASGTASYYYSLPHLKVAGKISRQGHPDPVVGEAWLDHEWSSEYLDGEAVGWNWIGINLDDGGALMAFSIRGRHGEQHWAGATIRTPDGGVHVMQPADVSFKARRYWVSPRTGVTYPIAWTVRAGARDIEIEPLLDNQENDTRLTTGAIYWEGAVRALADGRIVGRGYLELTGYGEKLSIR